MNLGFNSQKSQSYPNFKKPKSKTGFKRLLLFKLLIVATLLLAIRFVWASFDNKNSNQQQDSSYSGITTLMTAVSNHDVESVKYLAKSISGEIDKQNFGGATALHIACRNGDFEIASILVEAGANIKIADKEGWTPLMRAALAGNSEIIGLLLTRGAEVETINQYGEIAIFHAASANCSNCVLQLVRKLSMNEALQSPEIRSQMTQAYETAVSMNNKEAQDAIAAFNNELLKMANLNSGFKDPSNSEIENDLSDKESQQNSTQIYETKAKPADDSVLSTLSKNRLPRKFKLGSQNLKNRSGSGNNKALKAEEDEDENEYRVDSFDVAPNIKQTSRSANQTSLANKIPKKKIKFIFLQQKDFSNSKNPTNASESEKSSSEDNQYFESDLQNNEVLLNNSKILNSNSSSLLKSQQNQSKSLVKSFGKNPDENLGQIQIKSDKKVFLFKTEKSDANYGKDLSREKIILPKKLRIKKFRKPTENPAKTLGKIDEKSGLAVVEKNNSAKPTNKSSELLIKDQNISSSAPKALENATENTVKNDGSSILKQANQAPVKK